MYITIDGFEKLTSLQIWQMASDHINKTGVRSSIGRTCFYSKQGCAASVFIKPEFREQADGVGGWDTLCERELVPESYYDLVQQIQNCHDDWREDDGDFLHHFNSEMDGIKPNE